MIFYDDEEMRILGYFSIGSDDEYAEYGGGLEDRKVHAHTHDRYA